MNMIMELLVQNSAQYLPMKIQEMKLRREERKTDIYGPTCMISWICYTQLLYKNILHPKISLTVQHCNSHIL